MFITKNIFSPSVSSRTSAQGESSCGHHEGGMPPCSWPEEETNSISFFSDFSFFILFSTFHLILTFLTAFFIYILFYFSYFHYVPMAVSLMCLFYLCFYDFQSLVFVSLLIFKCFFPWILFSQCIFFPLDFGDFLSHPLSLISTFSIFPHFCLYSPTCSLISFLFSFFLLFLLVQIF